MLLTYMYMKSEHTFLRAHKHTHHMHTGEGAGAVGPAGENAGRSPGAASRDRDLYLQVSLSELTSTDFTARGSPAARLHFECFG